VLQTFLWLSQILSSIENIRPVPASDTLPSRLPLGRRLEDVAAKRYVRQNSFLFNMRAKFHGKGVGEQVHTAPGETEESCIQGQLGTDKDL
jgi:hypothetical protein